MLFYYKLLFILLPRELNIHMNSGFSKGFVSAPVAKSKATASLRMRFYLFFYVTRSDCFV